MESLERQKSDKNDEKAFKRKEAIDKRHFEVNNTIMKLKDINDELNSMSATDTRSLDKVRYKLTKLGFESILKDPERWHWPKEREFGRPHGFCGLILTTPNGVPVLIGREGAHCDDALRRIAQGSDLWFQVQDYNGSRVLLRTSLRKDLVDSKSCREFAANVAAHFSTSRYEEQVPVMYTDSKHVAKRGSKRGSMRKRKRLGTIIGYPSKVCNAVVDRVP